MKLPKLLEKGYLPVGDGHQLYYEVCGNPRGKPVLSLHGGPGAGFTDKHKLFYNPKKWKMIFFDQRGAGRSKPFASTKANTTQKLVEDCVKILDHVDVKKAVVVGGSWGSTLALCFAIKHSERVAALVLRGIYLGSRKENDYLYRGGTRLHNPLEWHRFSSLVPKGKDPIKYYVQKVKSTNVKIRNKHAYEWAFYEMSLLRLKPNTKIIKKDMKPKFYVAMASIEGHYMLHDCFLPKDYILVNAHKIKVPVSIIHGRYDVVCPPESAYLLHKKLPKSRLQYCIAGHSSSEPEIIKAMTSEIKKME